MNHPPLLARNRCADSVRAPVALCLPTAAPIWTGKRALPAATVTSLKANLHSKKQFQLQSLPATKTHQKGKKARNCIGCRFSVLDVGKPCKGCKRPDRAIHPSCGFGIASTPAHDAVLQNAWPLFEHVQHGAHARLEPTIRATTIDSRNNGHRGATLCRSGCDRG